MLQKIVPILVLITATLFGDSIPFSNPSQPGSQLVGQAFSQELCIKNDGNSTGYQPQFEVTTPPGITITTADFEGIAAIKYTQNCSMAECNVTNPFTNVGTKIDANATFYVLGIPHRFICYFTSKAMYGCGIQT